MSPICQRLPLIRSLLFLVALLLIAGCLGSDFADAPFGVEKWDHGWLIAVEPGEEFSVDLFGNNAYPDHQWQLVEYDSAVLRLGGQEHQKRRPPVPDVEAAEPGESGEGILVSRSGFRFAGVAVGRTPLRFEFVVEGVAIDTVEYTVEVVEDACAANTVAVANRCGGAGFTSHQQVLHERNFGEEVILDSGASTQLVLTANALYQDVPWQVVAYDDAVVAIDGPVALGSARSNGDYESELDAETSHSFLPTWEFTVIGVVPGDSDLVLEIAAGGRRVDLFEMTVRVE